MKTTLISGFTWDVSKKKVKIYQNCVKKIEIT